MPSTTEAKDGPTPRRKACSPCADSKVRCDFGIPSCIRCQRRGLQCIYTAKPPTEKERTSQEVDSTRASTPVYGAQTPRSLTSAPFDDANGSTHLSFRTGLDEPRATQTATRQENDSSRLICNIDAAKIQSRWLRSFAADPGDTPKTIPPGVQIFISNILASYTKAVVHGSTIPPFIHHSQLREGPSTQPLTDCFRLLRICDSRLPGSPDLAASLISKEMARLRACLDSASQESQSLLAVFQAYLLYSMALVFELDLLNHPSLQQAIFDLQRLASETASQGIVSAAELDASRPDWPTWIEVEAKRRTLYALYLFDNLLCLKTQTPVYLGTELRGMLAPSRGDLWRTSEAAEWQTIYNSYLAEWQGPRLTIDELWVASPDPSGSKSEKTTARITRWLQGADEHSTMLYAVTACIHGV